MEKEKRSKKGVLGLSPTRRSEGEEKPIKETQEQQLRWQNRENVISGFRESKDILAKGAIDQLGQTQSRSVVL